LNIETELSDLEEKLLTADFRRNREAVAALLAEDFREFGSSGRVWNKQEILDQLETETRFEAEIEGFQAMELSAGAVLVTYRATLRHAGSKSVSSLRSSVWMRRDNRWQIIFHQGTLTSNDWSKYIKSGRAASADFMEEVEDLPAQERDLF